MSLSNSAPDEKVSMDQVTSCLFNEETRRKSLGPSQQEALVTQDRGRGKNRKGGKARDKSRGKSVARKDVECWNCGKKGHYKHECHKKKSDKKGKGKEKEDESDSTAVASDGDVVVILSADHDTCLTASSQDTDWVIDSGASFHATPRRDFFTSYKSGDYGTVKMENSGVSKIVRVGDISLKTDVGCTLVLRDVRHIPDLRLNLMSTGRLDVAGYQSWFVGGHWKLIKGSMIAARGKICCTLYKTCVSICKGELNAAEDSATDMWHRRLGHMSEK